MIYIYISCIHNWQETYIYRSQISNIVEHSWLTTSSGVNGVAFENQTGFPYPAVNIYIYIERWSSLYLGNEWFSMLPCWFVGEFCIVLGDANPPRSLQVFLGGFLCFCGPWRDRFLMIHGQFQPVKTRSFPQEALPHEVRWCFWVERLGWEPLHFKRT